MFINEYHLLCNCDTLISLNYKYSNRQKKLIKLNSKCKPKVTVINQHWSTLINIFCTKFMNNNSFEFWDKWHTINTHTRRNRDWHRHNTETEIDTDTTQKQRLTQTQHRNRDWHTETEIDRHNTKTETDTDTTQKQRLTQTQHRKTQPHTSTQNDKLVLPVWSDSTSKPLNLYFGVVL